MKNHTGNIALDILLSVVTGVTVALFVTAILRKPQPPPLTLQDLHSL